ncbi:MarR family winged helix-turn-helix transcriptional regulator [Fastidiosibacter lacustris]|uniref:MarR family winged helix-turn-helix transcriptional regulator n=1 Tax=Fastidiosibacter lacustris TaxID=2056695 RepID=UPI00195EAB52|nr:MarR family transcriptional regulator [Fastidiosibacter lacustris]
MSTSQEINVAGLLGYKLKQTQHSLRLRMDEALKTLDLTTPQYAVLAQLELRPGISNAALARSAFITAQTMHGIVSNLEKRGLIHRKSDASHGRILCTELTKQGMKVVQQAHNVISKVEASMTSTITEDNKVLLEKLLLECFNNLHTNRMAPDIEDQ